MRGAFLFLTCLLLATVPAVAQDAGVADDFRRTLECPQRKYCTRVSSCREAVHLWCVCGYTRADADGDGVPCETLCGEGNDTSRARVREMVAALGCRPPR